MVQVLSTHLHEVVMDTRGLLPRFYELRNRAFANAVKCLRGWPEEVFNKSSATWVEICTPEALVKEMAYTVANCVAAGLVRTPSRWPGVKVTVDEVGRRVVRVKRPDVYFDANNPDWPDEVEIPIVMPEMLVQQYGSEDAARSVVQQQVDRRVHEAHAKLKHQGRGILGAKRVLKRPHTARASSWEPFGGRKPRFAAAGDPVVAQALIAQNRAFDRDYRIAWRNVKAGHHDVVFPYGTWKMSFSHGVRCRPPP
jgi:putative transposase